jgi:TPR repeat protein
VNDEAERIAILNTGPVAWLEAQAEDGHPEAQYALGTLYRVGGENVFPKGYNDPRVCVRGASQPFDEDFGSIKCAFQGKPERLWGTSKYKDPRIAVDWLERAAKKGCVNAQNDVGVMLAERSGPKSDYASALHWITLAANTDHHKALHNLALLYANGLGVEPDAMAAESYARAANEERSVPWLFWIDVNNSDIGNADAADAVLARHEVGDPMAKYCLGWYRLFDQSLIKIQHTAAELFAECYEATGYEVVPLILGMMYAHGIEVEPDLASARQKKRGIFG